MARNRPVDEMKYHKKHDPRVALFKQYYCDPQAPTFGNVLQSALKAGYSESYSNNITVQRPSWWVLLLEDGDVMRADMLMRAQKNLKSIVEEPKPDKADDKKLWYKASEFISGTLGKEHYSARQELTGANGKRLFDDSARERAKMPLESLLKGVKPGNSAPE